ncbi:butyrophilin-like protein 8 isoform X2 [Xiphophorus hellerii]|uniref:butyrophilin-like protein 8 isoform X2 n=1 Tax=Xiphophorus hellerii TaxID=8084 RepID=UPI0013B469A0|nr:butyrophilin-like protein 8 isoform X2 [Xiphophorus hellerii]
MFLVLLVMMFLMFCCLSSSSSLRMKMISRILLLLILSSCLCAATFVVNVTQSSYQAEENHNITLEWTFTTKTQGSSRELFIICDFRSSVKSGVIYLHHDGDEFPESQHEQFSGRVQIDKDVLREGRIRLHVSRLRTEDSGLYWCDVKTEDGFSNAECRLNVTAADQIQTQRPTLTPEPEQRWNIFIIILFITVGLTAAALMFLLSYFLVKCFQPADVYFSNDKETRETSVTSLLETLGSE